MSDISDLDKLSKHTVNKFDNYHGLCLSMEKDKDTSFYNEVLLSDIGEKTKNNNQILKKIAERNIINDTCNLDWYRNKYKRSDNIQELDKIFCDNIVFSGITTTTRVNKKVCVDCSAYNLILQGFFKNRQMNIESIKAIGLERPNNSFCSESRLTTFKEIVLKGSECTGEYMLQNFKVATADVDIDDILKCLSSSQQYFLNKNGIYLHDVDFTLDVAGCFDKVKFINYLVSTHDFHFQGEHDFEEDGLHKRINDNDDKVGRHCLSFWMLNNGVSMRCKIYNKFYCLMILPINVPFSCCII